jgi:2-amino-4-hydroxy-6-hydroxymethyldihydropteridine diphosphokinase
MAQAVVRVAIALGSNLGNRDAHLKRAVSQLASILDDLRVATFHDTEPVGVGPQPRFLNGAVTGLTSTSPQALLEELRRIEQQAGRQRPYPGAPRSLDLDLVLHGATVIDTPALVVPHPRFRERAFVLAPLSEIAPDMTDPVTGLTVAELWDTLRAR